MDVWCGRVFGLLVVGDVVGEEVVGNGDVGKEDTKKESKVDLILDDGTKAHGYNGKKNGFNVFIGKN